MDLWDLTGKDVSEVVTSGDVLTHVDSIDISSFSAKVVSKMVAGERGSTVGLRLTSAVSGRSYALELRRHVLIESQFQGVSELDQHSLLAHQEHLAHHLEVDIEDLERNWAHDDKGSLGIHIALGSEDKELGPKQVQYVLPGSTAHGRVLKGDEIVAVNGAPVTEENIKEKVRGHSLKGWSPPQPLVPRHCQATSTEPGVEILLLSLQARRAGEKVRLTVKREGKTFDEDLIRSSSFRLKKLDEIFELLDEHEDGLSELEDPGPLRKHQEIVEKMVHMEKEAAQLDFMLLRRMSDLVGHYRMKIQGLEAHLSTFEGDPNQPKVSKTSIPAQAAPAPKMQALKAPARAPARQVPPVDPESLTFAQRRARAQQAIDEDEALSRANGRNLQVV